MNPSNVDLYVASPCDAQSSVLRPTEFYYVYYTVSLYT